MQREHWYSLVWTDNESFSLEVCGVLSAVMSFIIVTYFYLFYVTTCLLLVVSSGSLHWRWCNYKFPPFHLLNTVQAGHWWANWWNKTRWCKRSSLVNPLDIKSSLCVSVLLCGFQTLHKSVCCHSLIFPLHHLVAKTCSRVAQGLPSHRFDVETKGSL